MLHSQCTLDEVVRTAANLKIQEALLLQRDRAMRFVDIYVPPTATYLQYRVIGLTPMADGLSQPLAQQSGTVSRISSGTRQSALTLSDVC